MKEQVFTTNDLSDETVAKMLQERFEKLSPEDKEKEGIIERVKKELRDADIPFWLIVEEKCNQGEIDVFGVHSGLKSEKNKDGSYTSGFSDFLKLHQAALFSCVYEKAQICAKKLEELGRIEEVGHQDIYNQILAGRLYYVDYINTISGE